MTGTKKLDKQIIWNSYRNKLNSGGDDSLQNQLGNAVTLFY